MVPNRISRVNHRHAHPSNSASSLEAYTKVGRLCPFWVHAKLLYSILPEHVADCVDRTYVCRSPELHSLDYIYNRKDLSSYISVW